MKNLSARSRIILLVVPAALPTNTGLSAADFKAILEQMRDTLCQHLPGPRGQLASEYVRFALARIARIP